MDIENINTKVVEITTTFLGNTTKFNSEIHIDDIDVETPFLIKPALVDKLSKVTAINIIDNDNDTTTFRFGCYGLNLIMDKKNVKEFEEILRNVTGIDTYSVRPYEIKNEMFYAIDYTIETPPDLNKVNQWVYDNLNEDMKIIITNC